MYCTLLAEAVGPRGRLQAMQRHMQTRDSDPTLWWGLLLVLGTGILLFLALYWIQRLQLRSGTSHNRNAGRLFQEVMQKLQLPLADRILLRRIARGLSLENPASILVSPSTLRQAAHQWAGQESGGVGRQEELRRLVEISRRIFGRTFAPFDANTPVAPEPPGDEDTED